MTRTLAALATMALLATGCQEQLGDVDTDLTFEQRDDSLSATVTNPDSITIYRNVDDFPNQVVVCIEGVALVTQSSTYASPQLRVPELDGPVCGAEG